jgi:signal transduction histidine kinase
MTYRFMTSAQCVTIFCAILLCFGTAYAQDPVLLTPGEDDVVLNPHTYLYKDHYAALDDIDRLLKVPATAFVRNTYYQEVNYGFLQRRGWCRFQVKNTTDQSDWILKVQQSRVDTVQLFIVRENGVPERYPLTGHFQTITQRPVYSLHFAYRVPIEKDETVTFYLYTQRQHGRHATILNLQREVFFQNYAHVFSVAISFICGMIMLAGLIGFVLYFFVREKVYLYYSLYCISFLVLIMVDSGFAHAVISYPEYQVVINNFTTIFYYWIGGWHILFTIELLKIKTYRFKSVYWLGFTSGWLFCIVSVLLMVPALPETLRWWMVLFSYYIVFFVNVYILYAISISIVKREPVVFFYLAGFLVTLIVATILVLADLQILDGVNQNTDLYYFTPLVEILFMVVGLGIHFSRNTKERFRAQLALNQTQNQIITIQEDERRRIAQDLHDDVGNSLAAIKNMVIQRRESTSVEKEIDNLIGAIRNISHNLMPVDFNEFALRDIIGHTVNKFKNHPTIVLEFDVTGEPVKIKPLTELVIYRIINELINNIFKHSRATEAFIQLIYQKESLVVTVEDNGVGIEKLKSEEGIGMRSIRLRAAYIHAKLNIESDDKGTLTILEVPYDTIE